MSEPLQEPSDAALGQASKRNLLEFFRFMALAPSCRTEHIGPFYRYASHVLHPWFNGIIIDAPRTQGDEARLATLVDELQQGGAPFTLWLESDALSELWAPLLEEQGFRYDIGAPGMGYPLRKLPPALQTPAAFHLRRLEGADGLEEWVVTFTRGYELPTSFDAALLALMQGIVAAGGDRLVNFIGTLDGKAVTTSNLFYAAGVAGIQFVATLPEARRMGLGGAMTLAPLYAAREQGYTAAILQASEMGEPVYRGLGFSHVGRVDNFYLPAQSG